MKLFESNRKRLLEKADFSPLTRQIGEIIAKKQLFLKELKNVQTALENLEKDGVKFDKSSSHDASGNNFKMYLKKDGGFSSQKDASAMERKINKIFKTAMPSALSDSHANYNGDISVSIYI
jgi:hypothetical protein